MKIVIDKEKIIEYLLKPRQRNDKSKFLNKLGFYEENWQFLKEAILKLYSQNDTESTEANQYGITYKVCGFLEGLNGSQLDIITIWINNYSSNELRFVTLFPKKNKNEI